MRRAAAALVAATALIACAEQGSRLHAAGSDVEWTHYGGDAGGTKYSKLADINKANVARLDTAWIVPVGDFPPEVFDVRDHRAGELRSDFRRVIGRTGASCGYCHDWQTRFEVTPIMANGTLYMSTPRNRVLALDPATGATRWSFDPEIDITQRYAEDLTSRGVSVWFDSAAEGTCSRRIFLATVDARLFALDAATGLPCEGFGDRGSVSLEVSVWYRDDHRGLGEYSVTSPATVVGDVVVVGSVVSKNRRRVHPSSVVRGFDVRTGALRWVFDPISRTDSLAWHPNAARHVRSIGGANVWSVMSADAERDLVFLPTGSPAPDSFGGERPGRNDFANSVVALRASTGELVWHFQVVHHDLWDYDVAAQPVLIEILREGVEVPAILAGTKTGMIFVLHRETGVPLLPVEERDVPMSDVPGERSWPTQPFPSTTFQLHNTLLTPDSVFGITDGDRAFCHERISRLRNEGIFTPPSLQGTLVWPGYWGGINWDGLAWDPERQLIVTTIKRLATVVQLHRRGDLPDPALETEVGIQRMPMQGSPYWMTRGPLVAPSGVPCTPPPWGSLVVFDLEAGSVRWTRPLGTVPALAGSSGSDNWGSIVFGGPLLTASGLVFVGASQDDWFRAFDVDTEALLWEYKLPGGGQAAPMSYRYMGRQYVIIAAGGRAGIGSPGDWLVAFALPDSIDARGDDD